MVTLVVAFFYAKFEFDSIRSVVSDESVQSLLRLPDVKMKDLELTVVGLTTEIRKRNFNKVFVHFWATWCVPCEAEFPELVNFSLKKQNDLFVFVAVSDEILKVRKFLDRFPAIKNNPRFILLIDNDGVYYNNFGTAKVPETYVFNNDTELSGVTKLVGPQQWDEIRI
jgi:thiol-disulfide isomerase/thioredoxin